MTIRIITKPTVEPVTLTEAKAHLRLEETRDDAMVVALITGARQYLEKICWRRFMLQTLELSRPGFGGDDKNELTPAWAPTGFGVERFQPYIELVGGHLATAPGVSVTYLDTDATPQILSSSVYAVQGELNDDMCGRLWLVDGYSWPDTATRFDAVKLTYSVGWSDVESVPQPIKQSLLLLLSQMYEYRTPEVTGTIATVLQFTIDALINPYRLTRL